MICSVKDALRSEGMRFEFYKELELPPIEYNGLIRFLKPVVVKSTYWCVGEGIKTEGTISTLLSLECDLCTKPYEMPLELVFEEQFTYEPLEEQDWYPISATDKIDFLPLVQDCIISAIPIERVCKEDCKGLCIYCGTDKNFSACLCTPPEKENAFSVLRKRVD